MKPIIKLASVTTPDGKMLTLSRRDDDFSMCVDRKELMNSRAHESELELARLGCARIAGRRNPTVLVGGLGMGYTLRQVLDLLQPGGRVVVAELMTEVVRWNREILGELAGHPLRDPRVSLKVSDVLDIIRSSPGVFDAILLDIDNGPEAMTAGGNDRVYSRYGIQACRAALQAAGCLAVWSAAVDASFERRLQQEQFDCHRHHVASRKGGKSRTRVILVAALTGDPCPRRTGTCSSLLGN